MLRGMHALPPISFPDAHNARGLGLAWGVVGPTRSSARGHVTSARPYDVRTQRRSEHHRGTPTRAEMAEMLVIDVILRGIRVSDAAAHLLIPVSTAYNILMRFDDDIVALMRLSQNRNHLYMRELRLAVQISTIWRMMHYLGLTNKRSQNLAREGNPTLQFLFVVEIQRRYLLDQCCWIDEVSADSRLSRRVYGWSLSDAYPRQRSVIFADNCITHHFQNWITDLQYKGSLHFIRESLMLVGNQQARHCVHNCSTLGGIPAYESMLARFDAGERAPM
ncbi:hypothetical protein T492DRAFT_916710 [Pavlovales sp. CCMP2436]|nr:hypothetical protein T492DRAFT_916710 [Pavlovales sp. CCMP2436]